MPAGVHHRAEQIRPFFSIFVVYERFQGHDLYYVGAEYLGQGFSRCHAYPYPCERAGAGGYSYAVYIISICSLLSEQFRYYRHQMLQVVHAAAAAFICLLDYLSLSVRRESGRGCSSCCFNSQYAHVKILLKNRLRPQTVTVCQIYEISYRRSVSELPLSISTSILPSGITSSMMSAHSIRQTPPASKYSSKPASRNSFAPERR